jgi:hypothetical protein
MKERRIEHVKKHMKTIGVNIEQGMVQTKNKISMDAHGYLRTSLGGTNVRIHQIIAIAAGLDIVDMDVNHIDGNKLNNRIDNLEAITHAANIQHAWDTGLITKKRATDHDKAAIIYDYKTTKTSYRKLALKYGINHNDIGRIIRGIL